METKRIILFILAIFFTCNLAEARTITVKVSNIRGENGTILVMAQSGKETKPVYGMAKPEKGEATITLENVEWEQFDMTKTAITKWTSPKIKSRLKDMP